MKKLLVLISIAMFLIATPVLATTQNNNGAAPGDSNGLGGNPLQGANMGNDKPVGNASESWCFDCDADATATGFYHGFAFDYDTDISQTGWWGNYNDGAFASADGMAGGTLQTYANAEGFKTLQWVQTHPWKWWEGHFEWVCSPAYASQYGELFGHVDPFAVTWAYDFGHTSVAGGFAVVHTYTDSYGSAFGLSGNREWVSSDLNVSGTVYQNNFAGETGYYAGGISGGNESGASFYGSDYDFDSGRGYASDYNFVEGGASTYGETYVTIDPYGSHRSIHGNTFNTANVEENRFLNYSHVYGNGGLGGMIQSRNGSWAGGVVDFSYNGSNNGMGQAVLDATVTNGTINVSGSSSSSVQSSSSQLVD
jgi:hypothetical protein